MMQQTHPAGEPGPTVHAAPWQPAAGPAAPISSGVDLRSRRSAAPAVAMQGGDPSEAPTASSELDLALAQLQRLLRLMPVPGTPPTGGAGPGEAPIDPMRLLKSGGYTRSVRAWMRQIVNLTRRAEAAEKRLQALEREIDAHLKDMVTLGRRFGQLPHETFASFVVRLGMTARAQPLGRGVASGPIAFDGLGSPASNPPAARAERSAAPAAR